MPTAEKRTSGRARLETKEQTVQQTPIETSLRDTTFAIAIEKDLVSAGLATILYHDNSQEDLSRAFADVREIEETPEVREYPRHTAPGQMHGYFLSCVEASYRGSQHLQNVTMTRSEMLAVKRFLGLRRDILKLPGEKAAPWHVRTPRLSDCFNLIDSADKAECELIGGALQRLRDPENPARAELLRSILLSNFFPTLDVEGVEAAIGVYRKAVAPKPPPTSKFNQSARPRKKRSANAR